MEEVRDRSGAREAVETIDAVARQGAVHEAQCRVAIIGVHVAILPFPTILASTRVVEMHVRARRAVLTFLLIIHINTIVHTYAARLSFPSCGACAVEIKGDSAGRSEKNADIKCLTCERIYSQQCSRF